MPRIKRNQGTAAKFRKMLCALCEKSYNVTGRHIISFKSDPLLDVEENMISVCVYHHGDIHTRGLHKVLSEKKLLWILEDKGFYFEGARIKLPYTTRLKWIEKNKNKLST